MEIGEIFYYVFKDHKIELGGKSTIHDFMAEYVKLSDTTFTLKSIYDTYMDQQKVYLKLFGQESENIKKKIESYAMDISKLDKNLIYTDKEECEKICGYIQ
jgi:hypothetical protein